MSDSTNFDPLLASYGWRQAGSTSTPATTSIPSRASPWVRPPAPQNRSTPTTRMTPQQLILSMISYLKQPGSSYFGHLWAAGALHAIVAGQASEGHEGCACDTPR